MSVIRLSERKTVCRRMRMRMCLAIATIFIAVTVDPATAADLIVNYNAEQSAPAGSLSSVLIRGEVGTEDSERLARLIASHAIRRHPLTFYLDSPGGSVLESIKIAKLITSVFGETNVDNSSAMARSATERPFVCASACFYMYLGGEIRRPSIQNVGGKIGVHRPYFSRSPGLTASKESAAHGEILKSVQSFLESKRVPSRLIEVSFSRSSAEIYWLSPTDLADVGYLSPGLEEIAIRECRYSSALLRNGYLDPSIGPQREVGASMTCLNAKLYSDISDSYERLVRGVRPWQMKH